MNKSKECLSFIDLTSLNATDTDLTIEGMVQKVNAFSQHFPHLNNVAAICIFPAFTKTARRMLTAPNVRIVVTGAGFPAPQTFLKVKIEECRMAVEEGADEVDIVLPLHYFLTGKLREAGEEINAIKQAIGSAHLKVILESGLLSAPESIAAAAMVAMEAGADFIKTSTGKTSPAATPEAASVMCSQIKAYYQKTGRQVGFKPAGGIVTVEDAHTYYAVVRTVLGVDWLTPQLFRIGASRLANNLLTAIEQTPVAYF